MPGIWAGLRLLYFGLYESNYLAEELNWLRNLSAWFLICHWMPTQLIIYSTDKHTNWTLNILWKWTSTRINIEDSKCGLTAKILHYTHVLGDFPVQIFEALKNRSGWAADKVMEVTENHHWTTIRYLKVSVITWSAANHLHFETNIHVARVKNDPLKNSHFAELVQGGETSP